VAVYNNLETIPSSVFQYPSDPEEKALLALRVDRAVRESAPAGWRGDQAREAQVLNALFPILERDREATKALFEIIKSRPEY
jgi:type I restriction enzyme R subunit